MTPWKFGESYWKPAFLGAKCELLVLGRVTPASFNIYIFSCEANGLNVGSSYVISTTALFLGASSRM